MTPEFIELARSSVTIQECIEVSKLYHEALKFETDESFINLLLFKIGVMQGCRLERERRKKNESLPN